MSQCMHIAVMNFLSVYCVCMLYTYGVCVGVNGCAWRIYTCAIIHEGLSHYTNQYLQHHMLKEVQPWDMVAVDMHRTSPHIMLNHIASYIFAILL